MILKTIFHETASFWNELKRTARKKQKLSNKLETIKIDT